MKLNHEEVQRIAELAKLGIDEIETERLSRQLSDILDNFEILKQIDTEEIPPTAQPNSLCNVMRDDEVQPSMPTEAVLHNAPRCEDDFIRIHAVLDED